MSDAAASRPAQPAEPAPPPPCPNCQEAICVVRLPRTWRECDEFHCNKCAHQWEVWDSEKARATEPHTIELIKTRSAYSQKEAEARDEKGRRLDAEARVRAAEARDLEPIVRLDSKLDTLVAQMKQPAPVLPSETKPVQAARKNGRPPDKFKEWRWGIIRAVAATGDEEEAYCKAMRGRLETHIKWQKDEGCPKEYIDAWQHPDPNQRKKWRHRISNERYNATKDDRPKVPKPKSP